MLVEAMKRLNDTNWDLLDEEYDGYDGEPREGEVSDDLAAAGIGHCRAYDIPHEISNDCVPRSVIEQIRNWKEETKMTLGMIDALRIGLVLVHGPTACAAPSPWVAVDAREVGGGGTG